MIRIPTIERKFVQTNRSNLLGNLWSSWNIDLDSNPGAIRLGKRWKINTKSGDVGITADFDVPVAFQPFDNFVFAICGGKVYKNGGQNLTSPFVADISTGVTADYTSSYSDMTIFSDSLVTTTDTKVYSKVSNTLGTGAWTERATGLTSSYHKLVYFKKFDRLYVSSGFSITSCDTSWLFSTFSDDYYLSTGNSVLANTGVVSTMVASSDSIWIAMYHHGINGDSLSSLASVYEWDGFSHQVTREHKLPAASVYAMILVNNVPHVMDSNGILRKFSGYSFEEIGRLPLRSEQYLGDPYSILADGRFIHPNGMAATENGTIQVLVCNINVNGTENENLPSGIWEWSKDSGFVHKSSISYMQSGTTTVSDYGQNVISKVGALTRVKLGSTSAQGTWLMGAEYYTDSSAVKSAILTDEPYPSDLPIRYGYFVTSWMLSEGLRDSWQNMFARYRKFLGENDKITGKYRLLESDPVTITIIWVTTSSFTTTTDVSSYVGYEVEVLQGKGSGKCSHITSVSFSNPNYTVTLDETYVGASGTGKARIQNWTKIPALNQGTDQAEFPIGQTAVRIQAKICLEMTGDADFYDLSIINKVHQPY